MQGAINDQVADADQRTEALAFLEQAQDFYEAATDRMSANPLLFYYSFVNLGKALLRTRGFSGSLDQAMHGLSERRTGTGIELANSIVVVQARRTDVVNIYSELIERLGFKDLIMTTRILYLRCSHGWWWAIGCGRRRRGEVSASSV